ncbi:MAG TPA: hypothetical protein VHG89_09255 [Verrucomicrobiae bacterium]|nr:hypothetical protein [Verrucomicrobiae bacterium]
MTTVGEIKFACPVCDQHIACNPALGGLPMQCPTCFQQILIPKAPTGATTTLILRTRRATPLPFKTPKLKMN